MNGLAWTGLAESVICIAFHVGVLYAALGGINGFSCIRFPHRIEPGAPLFRICCECGQWLRLTGRQFTPLLRVGSHNYTADKNEYDTNNRTGVWQAEGVAWYAVARQ